MRTLTRVLPIALAALLALACGSDEEEHTESCTLDLAPVPDTPATPAATPEPDDTDYGRQLAEMNAQVASLESAAERFANDWGRLERLSYEYSERARLTGDHADYHRAEEALERAFALAREGAGPWLSRAHLHFTLHRLDRASADVEQALQAALMNAATRRQIDALRADIAFHRGEFDEAERLHRATDVGLDSPASAFRIAYDLWQTGRFDEAERWLTTAEARVLPSDARTRAWMQLQMGLMDLDRGRHDDALAHYQTADETFSGWWLVHEHIAEIHACLEHHEEAERMYRDVVERTDNPELMDALADLLEETDQADEARVMRARAEAAFEHQLETLPEAAYGHALEHFLAHGTPERALELAEANHRLRPGGEATVRLAQALLKNGRAADARERLEALLETPYRTAELHMTASVALRATDEEERGAEQERLARAIDPHAMDDAAELALPD